MAKLTWILKWRHSHPFTIESEHRPITGINCQIIGIKVGRCRAIVEAGEKRDAQAITERANMELFHSMFVK